MPATLTFGLLIAFAAQFLGHVMKKPANERYDDSLVRVRPKVEIGWVLEGDLPDMERTVARSAAAEMKETLALYMPQFDWIVETIDRPSRSSRDLAEPVQLLDASEIDRDRRGWDFTIVVTARELHSREKVRALGVTAGIFATAIASTAFLKEPSSSERPVPPRLHALVMHLFGRLNGLAFEKSSTWMGRVEEASDLDTMVGFDETALKELSNRMAEVADVRVEEMAGRSPEQVKLLLAFSLAKSRRIAPRIFKNAPLELSVEATPTDNGRRLDPCCLDDDGRVLGGCDQPVGFSCGATFGHRSDSDQYLPHQRSASRSRSRGPPPRATRCQ